jgi:hypothetical protein
MPYSRANIRERRHRGVARGLVAVRRRAVLVISEGERPHPRRPDRRGSHRTVGERSSGWAARWRAFEDDMVMARCRSATRKAGH